MGKRERESERDRERVKQKKNNYKAPKILNLTEPARDDLSETN